MRFQGHGHPIHSAEALEQQNQVQSLLPEPHGQQRRWSHPQHRSVGVLPQPEPEEETKPFILDLKNFPDLSNADINSQNPNIQVSLEGGGHILLTVALIFTGIYKSCTSMKTAQS